jgi:hypothetical protein
MLTYCLRLFFVCVLATVGACTDSPSETDASADTSLTCEVGTLAHSGECCVDDAECTRTPASLYFGDAWVELSFPEDCPSCSGLTLAADLAAPYTTSVRTGCGVTSVRNMGNGFFFATRFYDSESGEIVGFEAVTNEFYTRTLSGCCGVYFRGGQTHAGCANIVDATPQP